MAMTIFVAEDELEKMRMAHVNDVFHAIDDFEQKLRSHWKYGDYGEETSEFINKLWDAWHATKIDNRINEIE